MIDIIDNFLTDFDCNLLIKFYKKNVNNNFKYYKSLPVGLIELDKYNNAVIKKFDDPYYSTIKNIKENVENVLRTKSKNFYKLYNAEIVKWPILSNMNNHYDRFGTEFSCIIYLNDNYVGGNTFIFDKCIKKKKGSLLIIKNSDKILHKVGKIFLGDRYTFPLWYGNELFFNTYFPN
jgi:hypothetical protein